MFSISVRQIVKTTNNTGCRQTYQILLRQCLHDARDKVHASGSSHATIAHLLRLTSGCWHRHVLQQCSCPSPGSRSIYFLIGVFLIPEIWTTTHSQKLITWWKVEWLEVLKHMHLHVHVISSNKTYHQWVLHPGLPSRKRRRSHLVSLLAWKMQVTARNWR